jgi:hypothetical protein
MRRSPLVDIGRISKYFIMSLISVFDTWVFWSRQMISLNKAHQDVHKVEGFFLQWSHLVSHLSKDLMQSHQNNIEV